ncbi:MAG TPA: hypothetical protein VGE41_02105 [Verrucomicrobiae bacterium]|jgi:hypothetical protein
MRIAIVLFIFDVGVRRIQLEREQVVKGLAFVRRHLLFWEHRPRPIEADESLAALLARRDKVRATQTVATPRPDLFTPATPVKLPDRDMSDAAEHTAPKEIKPTEEATKPEAPTSTTSRLLEAKRRAQRKKE